MLETEEEVETKTDNVAYDTSKLNWEAMTALVAKLRESDTETNTTGPVVKRDNYLIHTKHVNNESIPTLNTRPSTCTCKHVEVVVGVNGHAGFDSRASSFDLVFCFVISIPGRTSTASPRSS